MNDRTATSYAAGRRTSGRRCTGSPAKLGQASTRSEHASQTRMKACFESSASLIFIGMPNICLSVAFASSDANS